jgi:thiol-disulfide isomerase/thioredoxin
MSKIISKLQSSFAQHKRNVFIILLVIIFAIIGYYVYKKNATMSGQKSVQFKDVANANKNAERVDVYFFFADWCPHCINAKPEWEKFQEEYNGKQIGKLNIVCTQKDCSETKEAKFNKSEYGVESYPTIKVYIDKDMNNPIEYDAKITDDRLKMFIEEIEDAL